MISRAFCIFYAAVKEHGSVRGVTFSASPSPSRQHRGENPCEQLRAESTELLQDGERNNSVFGGQRSRADERMGLERITVPAQGAWSIPGDSREHSPKKDVHKPHWRRLKTQVKTQSSGSLEKSFLDWTVPSDVGNTGNCFQPGLFPVPLRIS